jgi:hypothetical protein
MPGSGSWYQIRIRMMVDRIRIQMMVPDQDPDHGIPDHDPDHGIPDQDPAHCTGSGSGSWYRIRINCNNFPHEENTAPESLNVATKSCSQERIIIDVAAENGVFHL